MRKLHHKHSPLARIRMNVDISFVEENDLLNQRHPYSIANSIVTVTATVKSGKEMFHVLCGDSNA